MKKPFEVYLYLKTLDFQEKGLVTFFVGDFVDTLDEDSFKTGYSND